MSYTDDRRLRDEDPVVVRDDGMAAQPYDDRRRVRADDAHVSVAEGPGGSADRTQPLGMGHSAGQGTPSEGSGHGTDVVDPLTRPDTRAKLLLAIALMSLVTLILALVIAVDVLSESDQPVLVDGVPCLVQEGDGENAVLYCQR